MSDASEAAPPLHLIGFRMEFRNLFPEMLAEIHEENPRERDPEDVAYVAERIRAAHREGLTLVRTVGLPGVPRIGDEVLANPNWPPVLVERVEWVLDPEEGDPLVLIELGLLDEDHVGAQGGALEMLLDSGWRPELDGIQ